MMLNVNRDVRWVVVTVGVALVVLAALFLFNELR